MAGNWGGHKGNSASLRDSRALRLASELADLRAANANPVPWQRPRHCGSCLFPSQKIRQVSTCRIFLSKPQAWHIIATQSWISSRAATALVSHHAPACIFLRLDDIQCSALMIYRNELRMIYTPSRDWDARMRKALELPCKI